MSYGAGGIEQAMHEFAGGRLRGVAAVDGLTKRQRHLDRRVWLAVLDDSHVRV